MKQYAAIMFLLASISLMSMRCKDDGVAPPSGPDTTSHTFTWQIDTLGNGNFNVLRDVAIISANNVWAVGEMYVKDSNGQVDPILYNAAKWNGVVWQLKRISVNFRGNLITPPLDGIFAFSSSQIWLAGGLAIYGDGNTWTPYDVRAITGFDTLYLGKCWGPNSSDMYFVGLHGSAAHYYNGTWQKLETGTTVNLQDIWGGQDARSGAKQILAVGAVNYPLDRIILSINANTVTQISAYPIQYQLASVWFVANEHYYVVGDGIFEKTALSDGAWKNSPLDITRYGTSRIRATGLNDVFVVGAFGEFLHWNGSTWRSFIDQTGLSNGSFASVGVTENFVVAVGENLFPGNLNSKAVIAIGKR